MEPYIFFPVAKNETMFSHEGEEFQYVLEGTHEFTYGDQKYILPQGDSIYFDSSVPHSGRSVETTGKDFGGNIFLQAIESYAGQGSGPWQIRRRLRDDETQR